MREWRLTVTDATRSRVPPPGALGFDPPGLAAATGGRLLRRGPRAIRGGAVDSRRVEPGMAFFALPGEHTDGHAFLEEAAARGAAALVVTRPPHEAHLERLGEVTVLVVRDALAALQACAGAWRARFSPLVVGVTGSVAKTSTKEAIAAVMGQQWRVLATAGNENNEVGLPLTLLRLGPEHEVAVLEMGMYVEGEIAQLAALARPSIGVVTAVRGVHLERAGSLAVIEREKGRLVEALPPQGTAVLNADDPRVMRMRRRTAAGVVAYGFGPAAEVTAEAVVGHGSAGMSFTLRLGERRLAVRTPALGRHNVHNALAAAAVGWVGGLDPAAIARGLAGGWSAPHRSLLVAAGPWRILDDSYNAGPDSMAAALDLLETLPGRRVAVLGEMLELGAGTAAAHRAVGQRAGGLVEVLVTVGEGGRTMARAARRAGLAADSIVAVDDAQAAFEALLPRLRDGDVVLVKGSRGVALEQLVASLRAAAGEAVPA
jgi:UDP-N-acetylmuramoyl-tripeptide--D-alanyl-D-alanine ligase